MGDDSFYIGSLSSDNMPQLPGGSSDLSESTEINGQVSNLADS